MPVRGQRDILQHVEPRLAQDTLTTEPAATRGTPPTQIQPVARSTPTRL
jgi:hypothetical protein